MDVCRACHGSADNSAPPRDTRGNTETSAAGVGAHQAHLNTALTTPLECLDCHVVPEQPADPGHMDSPLPAEITLGERAQTNGSAPAWDGTACTNVYCHGGTLKGGSHTDPIWTTVDGSQSTCGSCHGFPPPSPHPQNSNCSLCHTAIVGTSGNIIDAGLHINGHVDVAADLACTYCHGSEANPAPPVSVTGGTSTALRGVGAHQSHVAAGRISNVVACNECHIVPTSADDPGHYDNDLPAEVTFGALARTGGSAPGWDGSTCSDTYCHNPDPDDLNPSRLLAPVWTTVGGSQEQCGSCHGYPPWSPSHPTRSTRCSSCHSTVVASDDVTILDKAKHINGSVDVDDENTFPCNSCHGNATNDAPPNDLSGNSNTTAIGVGAHQAHLVDGALRVAVPCGECHVVPASVDAAGHIDVARPADVAFGPLAGKFRPTIPPAWNRVTGKCTNTYCHFPPFTGTPGYASAPVWTQVDGTQVQCNSCHMLPPQTNEHSFHFETWQNEACTNCHAPVMDDNGNIGDTSLHINGQLDVNYAYCATSGCHPWW